MVFVTCTSFNLRLCLLQLEPRAGIAYVRVVDLNDSVMPVLLEGGPGDTRMKMAMVVVKPVVDYMIEIWTLRTLD